MSAVIVVLLLAVVVSLGHALVSMSAGADRPLRVVRALTVRITLSVALFGLLMAGHYLGWIQPHGVH
jgi:Protein of unknown function (DUF2909)